MKLKRSLILGFILLTVGLIMWLSGTAVAQQAPDPPDGRLVIKDGYVQLMVENTEDAKATIEQIAAGQNAYIIQQQVWEDTQRFQYASYQFGLPADHFEAMLQSIRQVGTILDETATGQEVTDTAIDLTSRLQNLYANQARMQAFLDNAQNVTETLRVHEQLITLERDINALQGQLRAVSGRAEAATLTVELVPFIPTPTPMPTATSTPLPTPQSWSPATTAKVASVELQESVQNTADFAIFQGIICVPWLLLAGILVFLGFKLYQRVRGAAQRR